METKGLLVVGLGYCMPVAPVEDVLQTGNGGVGAHLNNVFLTCASAPRGESPALRTVSGDGRSRVDHRGG